MGFTPPSPDTLVDESGFTPPPPESLVDESRFTPPPPESLVAENPTGSGSSFEQLGRGIGRQLLNTGGALGRVALGLETPSRFIGDVQESSKGVGTILGAAGRSIYNSMGAQALAMTGDLSAAAQQLGFSPETVTRFGGTPQPLEPGQTPMDVGIANQSIPGQVLSRAVGGVIKSAPQVAAVTGLQAVGVPMPIGATAVFGSTEQGFDSKAAIIAAALPYLGRAGGAVAGAIAKKAGVSSIESVNALEAIGGMGAVAGAITAESAYEISKLPEGQRQSAWVDAAASVGSQLAFGPMGVKFTKGKKPPVIPPVVEATRFPLPEEAIKNLETVPVEPPVAKESLVGEISQLEKSASDQQIMAEAAQKQVADAAIQQKAAGKLVDEFGNGPIQFADEAKPVEPSSVKPTEQPAPVEAKPIEPAPVIEPPVKPVNEPAQFGAVPPIIESPTAMKYRQIDQERAQRGLPALSKPQGLSDQQAMDTAARAIDKDPGLGDRLAADLNNNPRVIEDWQNHVLLMRRIDLKKELRTLVNESIKANESGGATEDLSARLADIGAKLDANETASKVSGSKRGSALRSLRVMANEDYSLESLYTQAIADRGGVPFSKTEYASEVAKLKSTADEYAAKSKLQDERQAELDTRESAVAAEEARVAATDQVVKETAKAQATRKPATAAAVITYLDEAAQSARDRIKARGGSLMFNASPLSEIPNIKDWAIIGASHIAKGIVKVAWKTKMILEHGKGITPYLDGIYKESLKEHVEARKTHGTRDLKSERDTIIEGVKEAVADNAESPEIGRYAQSLAKNYIAEQVKMGRNAKDVTGEEIDKSVHSTLKELMPMSIREARDAWTGYGDFKPLDVNPVLVRYREARAEQQKLSTLENLLKGMPGEKTGQERQGATDLTRRRQKQINELKKELGITENGPNQLRSVLDAIHTRNKNLIADLRYENATRTKIVREKKASPFDAESVAQRAAIDLLRQENRDIFGKTELTDEQRLELALKSAERSEAAANLALERAKKGDFGPATAGKPMPVSAKLDAIKARAEAAREQVKLLRDVANAPGKAAQALESKRAALEKQIVEQKQRLASGDMAPSGQRANRPGDPVLEPLLQELAAVRKQIADARKAANYRTPDEIALQSAKTRTLTRIAELKDRMARGDFAPKAKRTFTPDSELNRLQAEKEQVIVDYKREREKQIWKDMTVFQKSTRTAANTYDSARMILTTGEFSFILRQGKIAALTHPIRTVRTGIEAVRAMNLGAAFKAARSLKIREALRELNSDVKARAIDLKTLNHPLSKQALADGLSLVDEGTPIKITEELIMGRWANVIPVVKNFNNAARVFLNKTRFDTWLALRNTASRGGTVTPEMGRAVAAFANESTGRGSLGAFEPASVILSRFMFSPKYFVSRLQYAAMHSLWMKSDAYTKTVIAAEYARSLIGWGIYISMLKWWFDDKDKPVTIENDPKASAFTKLKKGDTYLDTLAGFAQLATFSARTATGETKTGSGKIQPIRGSKVPFGQDDWRDIAGRFAWSKMHPVPGVIGNLLTGYDLAGNVATPGGEAMKLSAPITYADVYAALRAQDLDDATAMGILAYLGEGLQTYKPKPKSGGSSLIPD